MDRLFSDHAGAVYNYALRILGSREDAEDASQEVFRKAEAALRDFRGDVPVRAWLMRIALNVCLRTIEKRKRWLRAENPGVWPVTRYQSTEDEVMARLVAERILDSLPEPQRAAVWMRVGLQMTDDETAKALGVPTGTVKSWVWRALKALREECSAVKTEATLP